MEYRDYYATLGVPRTASQADIKKAYRKLARKHHPDVNAADREAAELRFKEINEANDVLGDPEKRKLYDQLGANWEQVQRAGGAGGAAGANPFAGGGFQGFPGGVRFEYSGNPEDLAGFSDFFRTFFAGGMGDATGATGGARGGRGSGGRTAGAAGAGTGARSGGGRRGLRIEDLFGGARAGGPTDPSGATGPAGPTGNGGSARPGTEAELEVSLEDVATGATARVQLGDKRLEVTVPKGIDTGQRIRLSGKAPGGGDLTLVAKVRPHPIFTRSGADVSRELPIALGEALLGAEIPVGTLAGKTLLLTIPAGTQNGRQFRLRGHGLPRFKAEGHGDLLVRARVVLPAALDDEGRRLAQQLIEHVDQPNPREGRPLTPDSGAATAGTSAGSPAGTPAGNGAQPG